MYTILVGSTNELITSVKERIMQRSKLVDELHFLVDPVYKGIPMEDFTVTMEYILPISREYHTETLVKSEELYKQKLEYKLPFDTQLTREAGNIEIQLTFTKVTLNPDGSNIQQVRKTSPTNITILPITSWSDVIPDSALTALDQRIIMTQAMLEAASEMADYLDEVKADNIVFDRETRTLQLMSHGKGIGDQVYIDGMQDGITALIIDEDGNLVAIYSDGTEHIVGKTGSACAGVYIPSLEGDMMTFTLSDKATEKVIRIDIDQSNNWSEISSDTGKTNYIWKEI